ncbi:hypothetical protein K439DRAFT_1623158 [Ramaria rubella]|nr:hypothetical protein K439DRAFT_1623158 [Ramaria rubella]
MPRGQGFTTKRVRVSGSRSIVINRLGRRQLSPSDEDEGHLHRPTGIQRITNAQLPQQREQDEQIGCAELQALPDSLRPAAVRMVLDTSHTASIDKQMVTDADTWEDEPVNIGMPAPEVHVDPSHEGGEYFHFIDMAQDSFSRKHRKYYQPSKHECVSTRRRAWQAQLPALFEAYMEYQYGTVANGEPADMTFFDMSILGTESWISWHCTGASHFGHPPSNSRTLPVQQWVKVLCDLANINYRQSIRDQFSDAFDTYLEILRQLAGEAELNPSIMGALDGNNSLKRFVREDQASDMLVFESDYFISHDYVEQFKDEVKWKVRKADGVEEETESDLTDGDAGEATCADCWQADTLKGIYNTFVETGVFVSVCRHGLIWTILDMMQSGELAKYPLATISRSQEIFPERLGLGYDIVCSFWSMLMRSSLAQFIFQNYKQALEVLQDMPVRIESLTSGRLISNAQYSSWLSEECKYLESKKAEPESDVLGVEYVELLNKYHEATVAQKLAAKFVRAKDKTWLHQVSHDAWESVLFLQQELQQVEGQLGIGAQWTLDSQEYQCATEYLRTRTYQGAVDKLKGLVVQRLFELTKVNVSQIGIQFSA